MLLERMICRGVDDVLATTRPLRSPPELASIPAYRSLSLWSSSNVDLLHFWNNLCCQNIEDFGICDIPQAEDHLIDA